MELLLLYLLYALALSIGLGVNGVRSRVPLPAGASVDSGRPERVLVVGASGGTGRELVRQGLDRGHEVTAFVRNPSKLKIEHPRLRIARGDVLDYDSVEEAVSGQDAVLSALGHKRYFYPTRILSEGTRNLLQAMETHNVPRFICETSLGIGSSAGRMGLYYTFFTIPVILPFYFWDKTRQERLIARSDTQWTIVRPGALTGGKKRGDYRHSAGSGLGSFLWTVRISRADVADFMLNQLTDDAYPGSAVAVCR